MEIMKAISQALKKVIAKVREESEASEERHLRKEANRRIQVREFDGELYVSIDNLPIIATAGGKADMVKTVSMVRDIYIRYKQTKNAGV